MDFEEKTAVILIGHGSKVAGASEAMERVASAIAEGSGLSRVEFCSMSNMPPLFPETLEKLVAAGEKNIIVIPYFLHEGAHIQSDIPEILLGEAGKYPDVKITMGRGLGYDPLLEELVLKRIGESIELPDIRQGFLEKENE